MSKQKEKILLVDDDPDFLELHKAVLVKHGYEVVTAANGEEAIGRVRTDMPDLIILDLMMEKHDAGFAFSKQIKNDPLFKNIPILMVSSVAEATGFGVSMEEDGYWMKTDEFLNKPVDPHVLISTVKQLIAGRKE